MKKIVEWANVKTTDFRPERYMSPKFCIVSNGAPSFTNFRHSTYFTMRQIAEYVGQHFVWQFFYRLQKIEAALDWLTRFSLFYFILFIYLFFFKDYGLIDKRNDGLEKNELCKIEKWAVLIGWILQLTVSANRLFMTPPSLTYICDVSTAIWPQTSKPSMIFN